MNDVLNPVLKTILKDLNNDNSLNLEGVDLNALQKDVRGEGVRNNTPYNDIKDAVIDLFESVGYKKYGIVDRI